MADTEAEQIDPHEHVDPNDPRYKGFRIKEYWIATSTDGDDQESPIFVDLINARKFSISAGVAMASDRRRLYHLRKFVKHMSDYYGAVITIRHFIPEGEPEIFLPTGGGATHD